MPPSVQNSVTLQSKIFVGFQQIPWQHFNTKIRDVKETCRLMAPCHYYQKIKNKKVRGNVYMHRKKGKMHVTFKGQNG